MDFKRLDTNVLSARLGAMQQVKNDGVLVQLCHWEGLDHEVSEMVVTATCSALEDLRTAPHFRPFIEVEFGTGGFLARLEVDVRRGQQLAITCSKVRVRAGADQYANEHGYVPMTYPVGAMLSFSPAEAHKLRRTRYIDLLQSGSSTKVHIPPFARSVVAEPGVGAANVTLGLLDSEGEQHMRYFKEAGWLSAMPLPGDATHVHVQNIGYKPATLKLVFEVALGWGQR